MQIDPEKLAQYRSYRDLPPVAGLCTVAEAARAGLEIKACVGRLKRYHYAFQRLHRVFIARITAEPIMEFKTAFSLHGYLCAEHVAALRGRVGEMREPPLGLEVVPDENLRLFFDEILAADTTAELVFGLYGKALPALRTALQRHIDQTNPLVDQPSIRVCRFALLELDDMIDFGRQAIEKLVDPRAEAAMRPWLDLLDAALVAAGGLDGADDIQPAELTPMRSATPYRYDPVPRRDERFSDLWNQGVNAEAFLYDPEMPAEAKVLMMLFKRLREIDVPEMMASYITETTGKPWAYYLDNSRQLWDEARHALMGEVGFAALGLDWTRIPITFNWSHRLNTECTPQERHAVLWFIEQGLMSKTGKRYEWEVAVQSANPLAELFQDYDWADEVLHAQLGRKWYVKEMGSRENAKAYGDACWSRVVSNWQALREQGLTEHANWWPGFYRAACAAAGTEPDPRALAFDTSYAESRADLKGVGASS